MSTGREVGGTQLLEGTAGSPLGGQVGTRWALVGKPVLGAWRAGLQHLKSPLTVGSLAQGAPSPPQPHPLPWKTQDSRIIRAWDREPHAGPFPHGLPTPGKAQQ